MANSTVPDWLYTYIHEWRKQLGIENWRLQIDVVDCIDGDEDIRGMCGAQVHIRTAQLSFRDDIEDTFEWRRTILHELLHVAHADVDHDVECVLIPELKSAKQTMARTVYQRSYEQFIDNLADTIARLEVSLLASTEPSPA